MNLGIKRFFRDIANYFSGGSVLGVDIGTTSIKVSELSQSQGEFHLSNYGILDSRDYLDHPSKALQTSSLEIVEGEAGRLLNILLKEMSPDTQTAIFAIPSFSSFVTLVDMPLLSEEETAQSMEYQARQYIPMDISEVSVDWFRVARYRKKNKDFQKLLLVGTPEAMISSLRAVGDRADLNIVAMELESIGAVRAITDFSVPTLVIDIGSESTNISVAQNGLVKFSSQADYGGSNVTRAVSKSLDLGMQRAEVLKKRKGLEGSSAGSDLRTLITPFLDVIIQEAEHVRNTYVRRYGKELEQITLIGGEAEMNGIGDYFANNLELDYTPPETFAPLNYPQGLAPAVSGLERRLSVSVGVAEKYFSM